MPRAAGTSVEGEYWFCTLWIGTVCSMDPDPSRATRLHWIPSNHLDSNELHAGHDTMDRSKVHDCRQPKPFIYRITCTGKGSYLIGSGAVSGHILLSPPMNQIDPNMLLAQEECGCCKRMEEHTIVPIREEGLHWALKHKIHVEGNPPLAHFENYDATMRNDDAIIESCMAEVRENRKKFVSPYFIFLVHHFS